MALFLLLAVSTVNFVDRQIFVILLEPVKSDLRLSDTQLGLLTGPAFALCFAVAGLPIARLAERRSRRAIIVVSLAVWSGLTAVCGAAQSFVQLMTARVMVAAAESGSGPASQSILADLYPHGQRATAFAILSCSIPLGTLIGLVAGGILNEIWGWRVAFVAVALPGLALAAIAAVLLKDPARASTGDRQSRPQGLTSALKQIWAIRSYRLLALAATAQLFAMAALNQWIASYFLRRFDVGTGEVGLALGVLIAVVGLLATVLAGWVADRWSRTRPQWLAWLPAMLVLAGAPPTLAMYLAEDFATALLFFVGPVIAGTAYAGPVFGAVQSLAPIHLRTTAAALTMLLGGILGQAAGPLAVGSLSDALLGIAGPDSLRWALVSVVPVSLVSGLLFWMAGRTMRADLPTSATDRSLDQAAAISGTAGGT